MTSQDQRRQITRNTAPDVVGCGWSGGCNPGDLAIRWLSRPAGWRRPGPFNHFFLTFAFHRPGVTLVHQAHWARGWSEARLEDLIRFKDAGPRRRRVLLCRLSAVTEENRRALWQGSLDWVGKKKAYGRFQTAVTLAFTGSLLGRWLKVVPAADESRVNCSEGGARKLAECLGWFYDLRNVPAEEPFDTVTPNSAWVVATRRWSPGWFLELR